MSELEIKVAEQLTKINAEDDGYDSTPDEPGEEDISSTDDSQAESADTKSNDDKLDKTVDKDVVTSNSSNDDGDSTEDTGNDESGVPDAYLRAALHQGWKQEEVEELWKDDQEKAERLLKANLTATNNLSNQWSQLGQQQMNTQVSPAVPVTTPVTPIQKSDEGFVGLDIDKLKGEYDDDNLINDVIKPMNDLLIKMNTKLSSVESQQTNTSQGIQDKQKAVDQERKEVIGQQIDTFFNSLKTKEFKDFYGEGSDWVKFKGNQAENRIKLLTLADQIKTGAEYQAGLSGKESEMTNERAMNLAHLSLSSFLIEQKVISNVKNSLIKRENSLSLKPSGSRTSSINDEKSDKSEKGLIKIIGSFMKKRGIKQH